MTLEELIESRNYLLVEQKKMLLEDAGSFEVGEYGMDDLVNVVLDAIFYKMFGFGVDKLGTDERLDLENVLKELGYGNE